MFKNLIFNLKVLHFNKWQCIIIFIWLHISNLWMTLQHLIQYQQLSLHWILEKCLLFLTFYCKLCTSTWLDLWVRRYFYTHYISLYLQCSPTLWESFIQFTENQNRTKKKKQKGEFLFVWLVELGHGSSVLFLEHTPPASGSQAFRFRLEPHLQMTGDGISFPSYLHEPIPIKELFLDRYR